MSLNIYFLGFTCMLAYSLRFRLRWPRRGDEKSVLVRSGAFAKQRDMT